MSKHTITPWIVGEATFPTKNNIYGADRVVIAHCVRGGDAVDGANAEHIVRAVNAFDDLLAACEAVAATTWSRNTAEKIGAQVRAAIAKARPPQTSGPLDGEGSSGGAP